MGDFTAVTQPKLLLADDSVTIRKVVELTFADEGIDVSTVSDAEAAMQKFVEIQPDIVLVDVGLSGTNGYHICEMIKQDEATRHIPVLLLVGSFEPFDQDEAERVEADGFLTKPFHSIRDLVARVWDLLGRTDASEAPVGKASNDQEPPVTTLETVDIDNLYQSSFADTVEIEDFDTVDDLLGDSGMDDEMIEASYPLQSFPDNFNEVSKAEEKEEQTKAFDWSPESLVSTSIPAEPEKSNFEPKFVFDESDDNNLTVAVETNDSVTKPLEEVSDFSRNDDDDELALENGVGETLREDAPEDNDNPEVNNTPELPDNVPALEPAEENALIQEDDERDEPSATIDDESSSPKTTDVLDQAIHKTIPYDDSEYPVAENSNNFEGFSPELIDLIARRVVEKLSDSIIREIAQDAVPRIAETLIREALKDESKT